MTEIPEHLLARSKARRSAIGQDEGGGAPDAPAASAAVEKAAPAAAAPAGLAGAPAMAPAKAPAAAAPAPPKPKRPEVLAAESRRKMPWWAAVAFVSLPLWAFLFAFTLEPPSKESPVLAAGRELYTSAGCSGCHGAAGEGGVGPAFADGAVVQTFADYNDHVQWVQLGSARWQAEVGPTYGDTAKPVLGFNGQQMPGFEGQLSPEEILEVVRYEREVLSGFGCEPELAQETGEECAPGTEAAAP